MKIIIKTAIITLVLSSCVNDKVVSDSDIKDKPIFYKCIARNMDIENGEISYDTRGNRKVHNQSVTIYLFNDSLAIINYDTLEYQDIQKKILDKIVDLKSNKEVDYSDENDWAWNKVKYYRKNNTFFIPCHRSFSNMLYRVSLNDTSTFCKYEEVIDGRIEKTNNLFKVIQ